MEKEIQPTEDWRPGQHETQVQKVRARQVPDSEEKNGLAAREASPAGEVPPLR